MVNRIFFENGCVYDLSTLDLYVIRQALIHLSYDIEDLPDKELVESYLNNLKHLFLDLLD